MFNERPVTRGEWLAVVRQGVRVAYSDAPVAALRWLRGPRKALLASGLLHLHGALLDHLAGESVAAQDHLDRAIEAVALVACDAGLHAGARKAHQPFPERWLAARALAGRAFLRTVRLGDPAAWRRIAQTIEWDADASPEIRPITGRW